MSFSGQMTRMAAVVGASTLLSRVLGFLRDVIMFSLYGTGFVADAFYVAHMIPALLRRLVGEGSLTVAFIPVYTRLREEKGEEEAARMVASFTTLMLAGLALLTGLGMIFARQIVWVFTNPDFRAREGGMVFELAVTMTRLVMPYLFFIGLVALAMGILNSHKRFFAPAFHPVLLNSFWLLSILLLDKFGFLPLLAERLKWEWLLRLHHDIPGLPIVLGILVGGVLQLALQIPFLLGLRITFRPGFHFRHPAIVRIGTLMLPSLFAVGVVQINTLISTYFITAFSGGRSQIFLATRITEFPYALISLAIATVSLPTLSELRTKGDHHAFTQTLTSGLKVMFFIMIPACIGLAFIAHPFLHLAFEHGRFSAADTAATANILFMLCLGLWAVGGLRIIVQAFYAYEDMKTPLVTALFAMAANAAGCFFFSRLLMSPGVALAISLASILNLLLLWSRLPGKVPGFHAPGLSRTITLSLLASLPMALAVAGLNLLPLWDEPGRILLKAVVLSGQLLFGGLLFLATARLLRVPELDVILEAFLRRLKR